MRRLFLSLLTLSAAVFPLAAHATPRLVRNLELTLALPADVRGHHVQNFKLFGPDGTLVAEVDRPYAVGVAREDGELPVAILEDGYELTVIVPVEAAAVSHYGPDAQFRLVVSRDGSAETEELDLGIEPFPELRSAQ